MNNEKQIIVHEYESAISEYISRFILEKRACGYIYNKEAELLKTFDKYIIAANYKSPILNRNIFDKYTNKRLDESVKTQYSRQSILVQLAKYIKKYNPDSYVPLYQPKMIEAKQFVPYIFSEKELESLFEQTDIYAATKTTSHFRNIMPVIYRLMYACGLRLSEAKNLRTHDVNLTDGLITIVNGKPGSNRILPVDPAMLDRLKEYVKRVHIQVDSEVLFPNRQGNVYSRKTIYTHFRHILWMAGISHGGRGKGPRIHDLRHTFAVHCIKRWVKLRMNVNALLPYLSSYMGHVSMNSTQYYLRLTIDAFPGLIETMTKLYSDIIPEHDNGGVENE